MSEKWFRVIDDDICISTEGLTYILDVSRRTLQDWEAKGCPKAKRGWWPLRPVLKWRGVANTTGGTDREKNLMQRKLEAEVAFKEAQGELTKLKNDITAGRYLECEYVETELKRFMVVFKRSVKNIPRRVSGAISRYVDSIEARRVEADLNETLDNVLEQLSIDGVYDGKARKV